MRRYYLYCRRLDQAAPPTLITVRGLRFAATGRWLCSMIIWSHAILLDEAPQAEWIFVGKQPGCVAMPQPMINQTVGGARTRAGSAGCPLEGAATRLSLAAARFEKKRWPLRQAGLPYEIVPGVSSAIAAPGLCGHPVDTARWSPPRLPWSPATKRLASPASSTELARGAGAHPYPCDLDGRE